VIHHHDLDETQVRVRALESLLVEKGYVDPAAVDAIVETYEHEVGPHLGAKVVARAWVDADFRARLLADATSAVAELGISGRQGEHLVAVENTDSVHNLVVCTLCSCYPWTVLGLPPVWYKSAPYRSRAVADPRGVLADFGVTLDEDVTVRVWDSTAGVRYLVVPRRPAGALSEEQLAGMVTRDAMIGVAVL
jgi:nitrile hydratase